MAKLANLAKFGHIIIFSKYGALTFLNLVIPNFAVIRFALSSYRFQDNNSLPPPPFSTKTIWFVGRPEFYRYIQSNFKESFELTFWNCLSHLYLSFFLFNIYLFPLVFKYTKMIDVHPFFTNFFGVHKKVLRNLF